MIAGLTGGIGSGKSVVSRLLEILGCAVFNSDLAAKEAYFDAGIPSKVKALLGNGSYSSENSLNKPFISSKVFGNTDLLHKLNAIIHPVVGDKFIAFCNANKGHVIIKETALLFEAGLETACDKIIVVAAPVELRIQRVMKRDGVSHKEVELRIKSQLPQEEKIKKADFVIQNDEKQMLIPQVLEVYKKLSA